MAIHDNINSVAHSAPIALPGQETTNRRNTMAQASPKDVAESRPIRICVGAGVLGETCAIRQAKRLTD